jgi:hypothetical protein
MTLTKRDNEIQTMRFPCWWTRDDDGVWDTKCNNRFEFIEDGPDANGFRFCPYCGNRLEMRSNPEPTHDNRSI